MNEENDCIRFKVYPGVGLFKIYGKSLYYLVTIFDKYKHAKKYIQKSYGKWHPKEKIAFSAMTQPFTTYYEHNKNKSRKLAPLIGEIVFCREQRFDSVVVAHEAMHATIFYCLRKNWSDKELKDIFFMEMESYGKKQVGMQEKFCYIQSNIMDQILAGYEKNKSTEDTKVQLLALSKKCKY